MVERDDGGRVSERIYVGADHAGFQLKQKLVDELKRLSTPTTGRRT